MWLASMMLALAALAPDVAGSLSALASSRAEEREGAERWLAAHLAVDDFERLASFLPNAELPNAELEPRARLALALGGDDRHFDLARRLALGSEVAVRDCGVRAVRAIVERWLGGSDGPPVTDAAPTPVAGEARQPLRLELAGASLEELVDLLARRGGLGGGALAGGDAVPLCIDLGLAADAELPRAEPELRTGAWGELVAATARRFGARHWLYGNGETRAFAVLARIGVAEPRSATEWILLRTKAALDSPDVGERERAARAVAAVGFAPAIELLAERFRLDGDVAALSGLTLAAARGRVAPALCTVDAARALVRRAEAALARGGSRARFVAAECGRALAGLGDTTDGARPLDVLGESLERCTDEQLAWRLRVATLARAASAPLDQAARAALANPAPSVERAAVAAAGFAYLVAATPGPLGRVEAAAPRALLAAEMQRGRGVTFVEAWARAGLDVPREWREPALATDVALAVFDAEWRAERPDDALVDRFIALVRADLEAVEERIDLWRRRGRLEAVNALLDAAKKRATDAGPRDVLDRLDARLARIDDARAEALLARFSAPPNVDWLAVGGLAGSQVGARAREALVVALGSLASDAAPSDPLGRGIERAWTVLRSRGDRAAADAFLGEVRDALRAAKRTRFLEALASRAWPLAPATRPLDLRLQDLPDGF
ncbi:MAG: hypothetical protein K8S98_02780 [Planctomycetes bacterium]|nr:hypothetical protein [Planctomycetota bacterium]